MGMIMRTAAVVLVIASGVGTLLASRRLSPEHRLQRRLGTALVVVLALPIPLLHGRWIYMTARCGGQPVATTDFASANTYRLPTDPGYSRSEVTLDYVCTEAEALAEGYDRGPGF
jgi:hypothetical protein